VERSRPATGHLTGGWGEANSIEAERLLLRSSLDSAPDTAKLALRVLTSPGIAGATGAMVELAAFRFGLAMVPPNSQQTADSVLIPKYYRPSDFVITCGNREVVYSFGWEAPVVPRRIGVSWAPNF